MNRKISIQEIINGCKANNARCQRALVDHYCDRLYAICIRYIGDKHKAKDVLQEVYMRIFNKFQLYDSAKGNLYSWMATITVRHCINELKKNKRKHIDLEIISNEIYSQDMSALERMSQQELLEKVASLPEGYRQVFNLYVFEGYSHKEIAEMMGFKEVTSRSKFHRARKLLLDGLTASKYKQYG